MALNSIIENAIEIAVEDAGQSSSLSQKIIAWINAVTSGNEDINDSQAAKRHLDLIYEETITEDNLEDS